jgi:hypothetical protein
MIADPFSWIAGFDPLSAATTSPVDLDISVDGFQLLDLGTGASATSGMWDLAIAIGDGSQANAGAGIGFLEPLTPGQFDIAVANGTDSVATTGQATSTAPLPRACTAWPASATTAF